jgi:DNA-binding MarR family transcriptional regulator
MAMSKKEKNILAEPSEMPIEFEVKPHEALLSLWWTANMVSKLSNRFFSEHLASEAQFNVLVLVKDSKELMTQNDLSKKLFVDKSNITGLIDRLEKQKLISREKVAGDRRSYHIKLTKAGDTLITKLNAEYMKHVLLVMKEFSDKECEELIRLTRKVRKGVANL